jgi:hypothetical protein
MVCRYFINEIIYFTGSNCNVSEWKWPIVGDTPYNLSSATTLTFNIDKPTLTDIITRMVAVFVSSKTKAWINTTSIDGYPTVTTAIGCINTTVNDTYFEIQLNYINDTTGQIQPPDVNISLPLLKSASIVRYSMFCILLIFIQFTANVSNVTTVLENVSIELLSIHLPDNTDIEHMTLVSCSSLELSIDLATDWCRL